MRAEYPNQLDSSGSAMISVDKRSRFAGGSECARPALRKTRQADVCSHGYGVSGFSEPGPRQAEKRAAPGIEPRTSRTRSENHTTRPSSRWRTTTSASHLEAPRPPPATPTAAARTCHQPPRVVANCPRDKRILAPARVAFDYFRPSFQNSLDVSMNSIGCLV